MSDFLSTRIRWNHIKMFMFFGIGWDQMKMFLWNEMATRNYLVCFCQVRWGKPQMKILGNGFNLKADIWEMDARLRSFCAYQVDSFDKVFAASWLFGQMKLFPLSLSPQDWCSPFQNCCWKLFQNCCWQFSFLGFQQIENIIQSWSNILLRTCIPASRVMNIYEV